MPLRNDLLTPIAGENPSGASLRYERIYDQIKDARTEDDESLPVGDWQRSAKKADFAQVIKLAGDALASRSKDLQLLAWLTEAHIRREGIAALPACLATFLAMQQEFWDTLHPEVEEGDSGLRAMPVEWMANRVSALLREAPVTKSGLNSYQYKTSRTVGYEADASSSDARRTAREQAIAEGKITAEDFDAALRATPKSFYVEIEQAFTESGQTLEALIAFCDERYGIDGPSFSRLQAAMEEVKQVVGALLMEKRKLEPDAPAEVLPPEPPSPEAPPEPPMQQAPMETSAVSIAAPPATSAAPPAPAAAQRASFADPASPEAAIAAVQACARVLCAQDESSPVAYLLQTGLRWGELRSRGGSADAEFAVPPPADVRRQLKRLLSEASWSELLRRSVESAGEPCGRTWLDVHRYIWRASQELGYAALETAVTSGLASILAAIPELPHWTFNDDTPTANAETLRWLEEVVLPRPAEPEPAMISPPPPPIDFPGADQKTNGAAENSVEDLLETARGLMQQGRAQQAIQLLVRDAAQQGSGRLRFRRRTQVAQLCLSAGFESVALPMLEQLAAEIEQRRLEGWESGEMLAEPLALLLKCLRQKPDGDAERQEIFAKLCRLDPTSAMDYTG